MIRKDKELISRVYNKFLNIIVDKFHDRTTYTSQLDQIGKVLFTPHWRGVFPRDMIPKKLKVGDKLIFNLDKSTQAGSHWCALYFDGKNKYVYDSFARNVLGSNYRYTDSVAEQKESELNCGQRCLAWLLCVKHLGINRAMLI